MPRRSALAAGLALLAVGMAPARADDSEPPIGTATLEADGTLVLMLRAEAEDGTLGEARLVYRPGDAEYDAVRAHVGPIAPGETVPVRPFPP